MYSIVLMAALSMTGDVPAHHNSCHGCCGYSSCHGCHGGYYNSGYGCCGGYYGGCYGCCGGYYGGYSYGCCGGFGYGCCGGYYGGCCGGGVWGSPYGMVPVVPGTVVPGTVVPGKAAEMAPAPKAGDKPAPAPEGAAANTGRLLIDVPEDTRIFVDDRAINATPGQRSFSTPTLDRATAYYYIVRAETTVEGKPQVETKQVIVRAGQVSEVSFPRLVALKNAAKSKDLAAAAR